MKTRTKPLWLNKKINLGKCADLDRLFKELSLNTVCRQAHCPNIAECFSAKVATFLILGRVCTRGCRFCAVEKGKTSDVDKTEPERVAAAVRQLGLRHVVITSVTRDDLEDGGAQAFYDTVSAIKRLDEGISVEVLVPDFQAQRESIEKVLSCGPEVFAHNVETVPRLYAQVRSAADYRRSLSVLSMAAKGDKHVHVKSGIMLGMGETEDELLSVFDDLRVAGCEFLSIGQYLAPSKNHFPVQSFIPPEMFASYKTEALKRGFKHVESGPYVRSSYHAVEYVTAHSS
ncbi:MAG: lipoyl synthase [Candidatus Omnitrophica bacterium]|nr:lipoyl synthase [Candidatus Omnitrophota bacterium]MBU4478824.1 lipoyl synthase [Candidatus Omnitrophota bacterium]